MTSWTSTASSSRRTRSNVDELLDSLAQRAAAAQRFRNSLSADQRAELDALAPAGVRLAVADERAQPARRAPAGGPARRGLGPVRRGSPATTRWAWARAPRRWPTSPSSKQLAEALSQSYAGRRRWTTSTSTRWPASSATRPRSTPRTLAELERALVNQGFLDRGSDGQWRLSPKAMRQLGQTGVARCGPTAFGPARRTRHPARRGRRRADRARRGRGQFWRHRAVERHPHADQRGAAAGGYRRRRSCRCASPSTMSRSPRRRPARRPRWRCWWTPSFSMVMENRWLPMKRTALALQPSDQHPVPLGCAADHRLRPVRADGAAPPN